MNTADNISSVSVKDSDLAEPKENVFRAEVIHIIISSIVLQRS